MTDGIDLPIAGGDDSSGLDDDVVLSMFPHGEQDNDINEARELLSQITAGQVRIAITTAVCGLLVSTVFALTLLAVWAWHAFHGNVMPSVPLFIISIATAPFVAGTITTIYIPRKTPWRLGKKGDRV